MSFVSPFQSYYRYLDQHLKRTLIDYRQNETFQELKMCTFVEIELRTLDIVINMNFNI